MKKLSCHFIVLLAALMWVRPMYAQSGWQWAMSSAYDPVPHPGLTVAGAALDDSGNVVVVGATSSPGGLSYVDYVTYGTEVISLPCACVQQVIVKTDSNGTVKWARGGLNGSGEPYGIDVDRQGNIYVVGRYNSDSISFDTITLMNTSSWTYYLVKYSPGGQVMWARNIIGSTRQLQQAQIGVGGSDADGGENVYVSGIFYAATDTIDGITITNASPGGDTCDGFMVKFTTSGTAVWARSFGGRNSDFPWAMSVTPVGNVYMTGFFTIDTFRVDGFSLPVSPPGSVGWTTTPFLVKFDKDGHAIWAKRDTSALELYAIATDEADNIYLTGLLKGDIVQGTDTLDNIGTFNTYVAKFDNAGNRLWARCAGSHDIDNGWSIAVDSCDRVLVSGLSNGMHFGDSGTMYFGDDTLHMPAVNWNPTFVAQYSKSGDYISSASFSSGAYKEYILADKRGSYFLAGSYVRVPIDFGAYSLPAPPSIFNPPLLFLAKNRYDTVGCYHEPPPAQVQEMQQSTSYMLAPNPAVNTCVVRCSSIPAPGTWAHIYDVSGRKVTEKMLQGSETAISLDGLLPGMYYCRIVNGTEAGTTLKLVVLE